MLRLLLLILTCPLCVPAPGASGWSPRCRAVGARQEGSHSWRVLQGGKLASLSDLAVPSPPGDLAWFQSTLRFKIFLHAFMGVRRLVTVSLARASLQDFILLSKEIRPLKGLKDVGLGDV